MLSAYYQSEKQIGNLQVLDRNIWIPFCPCCSGDASHLPSLGLHTAALVDTSLTLMTAMNFHSHWLWQGADCKSYISFWEFRRRKRRFGEVSSNFMKSLIFCCPTVWLFWTSCNVCCLLLVPFFHPLFCSPSSITSPVLCSVPPSLLSHVFKRIYKPQTQVWEPLLYFFTIAELIAKFFLNFCFILCVRSYVNCHS